MVLPRFVRAAMKGETIRVFGDGTQSRCFCDVRDVVGVMPRLLADESCRGRVFNLGSDVPVTIRELAETVGREVISLTLVDPEFYHLDTAIAVLDPDPAPGQQANIAYLPKAFDEASQAILRERYPDAIIATEEDAAVLGLNSFSDGLHVVIASRATDFDRQLRERGYEPIGVDLSELLLGGGGVKCCTLELRR